MCVLVTGATGFLGGYTARRLAGEMQVRCLVRSLARAAELNHSQIELVQGDLTDPASLEAAVAGVDVVVHAATDTALADARTVWAVSVAGTKALYDAARRAGVKRFLFISTAAVYGGGGSTDEEARLEPYGDRYADAKIAAERYLLDAPAGGPEVAILRPPFIYGPGSRWTRETVANARKGKLVLPLGGNFPYPCVYVENMVDAIVAAIKAERVQGAYNIFDFVPTYAEFMQPILSAYGLQPRSIPYGALWLVAAVGELYGKLTGKYVPLSRHNLAAMAGKKGRSGTFSREKARRDLGWEPRISFDEAMRATLAWAQKA
jgi:nucleoside-diphosphate-sugar epimerase